MKRNDLSWLPNLLTGFNLFLGFWAVILIFEGNILSACWLVIVASIFDALDGKLARFTRSSTEIGIELDSLSDAVSFGAVPGILLYAVYFHTFGFAGVVLASFPLLFGVIRLARYNLSASVSVKKTYFEGLPIPMQANTIASFILFNHSIWGDLHLELILIPMTLLLAFFMVSHIPFEGIPRFGAREISDHPVKLIIIAVVILLISLNPQRTFFPLIVMYILRNLFLWLFVAAKDEELETAFEELEVHQDPEDH